MYFKVETIGDCYVAAAGVPNPMKKHAIIMSRFASSCILKMRKVVTQLEVTLGELKHLRFAQRCFK